MTVPNAAGAVKVMSGGLTRLELAEKPDAHSAHSAA
jgi:hypothetical protein